MFLYMYISGTSLSWLTTGSAGTIDNEGKLKTDEILTSQFYFNSTLQTWIHLTKWIVESRKVQQGKLTSITITKVVEVFTNVSRLEICMLVKAATHTIKWILQLLWRLWKFKFKTPLVLTGRQLMYTVLYMPHQHLGKDSWKSHIQYSWILISIH